MITMFDINFLRLMAANLAGIVAVMGITYLIYRRGIALTVNATIVGCIVWVDILSYFLGKEEITLYRAGICRVVGSVPADGRNADETTQYTQYNSAAAEELAATAEELASQAEQLQEAMAFFKMEEAN